MGYRAARHKRRRTILLAAGLAALLLAAAAALLQGRSARVAGQRYAADTRMLDLTGASSPDLSALQRLTELSALCLDGCERVDLAPLAACPTLRTLSLRDAAGTALAPLARCTGLTALDLTGTAVTAADYDALRRALPGCAILWDVPLSTGPVTSAAAALTLPGMTAADAALLGCFPALQSVDATGADCYDALLAAERAYPGVTFEWTVEAFGAAVPHTASSLDLTNAAIPDAAALMAVLPYFPNLAAVDLRGSGLTGAAVFPVQDAFPNVAFSYELTLCGVAAESGAAAIDLSGVPVSDTAELYETLPHLTALTALDMCNCGLSNEEMGKLCADFPGIRFVWIVQLGKKWSLRTDAKYFSTKHSPQKQFARFRLTTEDIQALQYCTELEALDLGHHSISDISVLAGLKKLRILILADNRISDITPLASLERLEYAELFLCRISDVSPLAGHPALKHLNVAHNRIKDLSPLYSNTGLERLWAASNGLSRDEKAAMRAALPDCACEFDEYESTGAGWREHAIYFELRELFQYS